jgi:hypothetical protein
MAALSTREAAIVLRDQDGWKTWINQIQARAAAYNIWNNLNPEHPVPFLTKPTLPTLIDLLIYHAVAAV